MVYLLHFAKSISPRHTTRHYIGFCEEWRLDARIAEHRRGDGARLTQVAAARGIPFTVARLWPGLARRDERRIKDRHNGPRECPVCNAGIPF